ncbi:MAG: cation-translocating P-type ATPase [Clostridia bacterium]|nr:cation-translocating P-type ATPase [Clostridia bacterium]
MKEYLTELGEVLEAQGSTSLGLSASEAQRRAELYGANKLKEGKRTTVLQRFLKELANPMIIILIVAALVSGITAIYADESLADVIIIMAVVIINAVLGVVQESKAEKAIKALQDIAAATSKVLRDGRQLTIRSEELVPGDIIVLEAGDAVPADARIIECASMKVEEAALTGESVPVNKTADALDLGEAADVPLGDRRNMVYMGSTLVYGRGKAVVVATGMDTEMGKIAEAISNAKEEATPLQRKLNGLSKVLTFLVIGVCAVIFAIDVLRIYPDVSGAALLDTFMIAVSLAVAAIPEGLAAVVTIVLSIGVTNMSRRNAVIRRLTAVETLGCTQVICSDKTGTLTQNKMTVVEHSGDVDALAVAMALCSDAKLSPEGGAIGEPTECALVNDAHALGVLEGLKYERIGEAPFDSMRKMMSTVCEMGDGSIVQYTKGAPDEVLKRCTHALIRGEVTPLTDALRAEILESNRAMANKALRVLCAASKPHDRAPESYDYQYLERDLCYLGLSGMIDPIRPEVRAAIEQCRRAGIRPIMITGDHRDTAVAIAKQLGMIESEAEAISGTALDSMSDEELLENIERYSVYARVQPEHKVRIVSAWKARELITAMTGDGVNDAPSIKIADIGVGMGITGTDVTKNVADMVLTDDNFATIVSAVEEGRRIYANIRKCVQFLLSSNLAEVLSIFVSTLMGFTILRPAHLLWINLITDCFPALALGMEPNEADSMATPPRSSREGIFAGGVGVSIGVQGVMITALTLLSYFIGHFVEFGRWEIVDSADGMTMAFLTLSLVQIAHSFNMRSQRGSLFTLPRGNKWLIGSAAVSLLCTVAVVYVPFLAAAFGFEAVSLAEFAIASGLALTIIPLVELMKLVRRALAKRTRRLA